MSDGAHLGLNAAEAAKAIIGGHEPGDGVSTREMAARIRATTSDPHTYSGTADYCAFLVLSWLEAEPSRAQTPSETVYDWERDPHHGSRGRKPEYTTAVGWYEQMEAQGIIPADGLDLTGFMWGWAVNAARAILELPPVPNPAILEV